MYLPDHFRNADIANILELTEQHPLAVISGIVDGAVDASHIPVIVDSNNDGCLIARFHLTNMNPLCSIFDGNADALLVFTGAEAYISPDWYGTKDQVPTWNYASVQLRGRPKAVADADLMTLLDDLSAAGESALPKTPWTIAKVDERRYTGMRRAITGYSMIVDDVQGKWKMNQNRRPDERANVINALTELGDEKHLYVRDTIVQVTGDD